jgi:PucR C-terminal helix-turn-helix domain/GGDEF-like domain
MRIEEIRSGLAKRLRDRRPEIEQAALTRINAVAEVGESSDPAYRDGLKAAVCAALEYGIEAVEHSSERPPPMPTVLLAQARLAARHGVKLETVLRRYLAGYTLLGDFLIEESERGGALNGASLKRLLRVQASLLDGLIAAVSEEYAREAAARPGSSEERRAELVRRLLDGELLDTSELAYDFEGHHLGLIASGPDPVGVVSELARGVDCCSLIVRRDPETAWAWLGARQRLESGDLADRFRRSDNEEVRIAIGEPGEGLSGWRLTHRQAAAAFSVAQRGAEKSIRYSEVALLASVLQDDLLAHSLCQLYLQPLRSERDGGEIIRETLRAYLAAGGSLSSAASILGVSRRTVGNRLLRVEKLVGRQIHTVITDIDIALRLNEHVLIELPPESDY